MTAVFQYISDYIFNFYMGFKKKKYSNHFVLLSILGSPCIWLLWTKTRYLPYKEINYLTKELCPFAETWRDFHSRKGILFLKVKEGN